nr:MAG TPA: hypothetical protein [Caudoviricetes sp.]
MTRSIKDFNEEMAAKGYTLHADFSFSRRPVPSANKLIDRTNHEPHADHLRGVQHRQR